MFSFQSKRNQIILVHLLTVAFDSIHYNYLFTSFTLELLVSYTVLHF